MFPERKDRFYRFDNFTVDTARRLLLCEDRPVSLNPKAFDLLLVLIENRGQVLAKEELLDRVWPNQFVEEGNLSVHMSAVRKALGERRGEPRYVVTIPGRGYTFSPGVAEGHQSDKHAGIRAVPLTDADLVIEQLTLSRVVVEHEGEERDEFVNGAIGIAATPQHLAMEPPESPKPNTLVARAARNRKAMLAITAGVLVTIASSAGYWYATRSGAGGRRISTLPNRLRGPAGQMKVTRITNKGRVKSAAVSPDGKYAAYILGDVLAGDSIHLTEPGTSNDVVVLAPEESSLSAIMFSADGESLYFYRQKKDESRYYKIPILGGAFEGILPGVQSSITLSPDGRRVAFLETHPEVSETVLMLANTEDGGDRQKLAALAWPRSFTSDGLAWSPDGQVIAIGVSGPEQQFTRLVTVQLADGTITQMSTREWGNIRDLAWISDGSGLVMVAGDDEMVDATQVWLATYPDGETLRITNDILRYGSDISVSSSANELVVVATRLATNIWVSPIADPSQARQATFGTEGRFDGLYGLHWTPDERIAYGAYVGYAQTIWMMNEDGSNQRQLTPGQRHISDSAIRASADGRYIVFHSNRSGSAEIWRIDIDGGNPTQITTGGTNYQPAVSPDTKWVFYRSWEDGKGLLWKAPLDGGTRVRLTDKPAAWPGVSPDGRFIACASEGKLIVIRFDGGAPLKTFGMPPTATLYPHGAIWSPDGSALLYRDTIRGIWRQALASGNPEKIPGMRSETVFNFAISPDGQKLAVTYGSESSDAVLISNFQ